MTTRFIRQGDTATLVIDPGIDPGDLVSYRVTVFQDGEPMIVKDETDCTIEDGLVQSVLSQSETIALTPARLGVYLRGERSDGSIFQSGETPVAVERSPYRATYS